MTAPVKKISDFMQVWNDGATVFAGIGLDIDNQASALESNLIDLKIAGVTQFRVRKDGLTEVGFDIQPLVDDVWLGSAEYPFHGLSVGKVTVDPENQPGIEGVVGHRDLLPQVGLRGVLIGGFGDNADPRALPDEPNLPVHIFGSFNIVTGPLVIEVNEAVTADRYLAVGDSFLGTDGRHYSPVILGPEIVYSATDEATDTRDINLDEVGTEEVVVSMVLANDYAADVSTFSLRINLSEEGGRTVDFTVNVYVDTVLVYSADVSRAGTTDLFTDSRVLVAGLTTGQTVEMRVLGVGTHPQSDGWVRGASQASEIRLSR